MCELRSRAGTFCRFEFDHTGESFDDGGLADARLADEHRRIGPLAVAEDFDHLLDLALTPDDRRQFVLPRELVERDAEMFEVRRKFVLLAERFGLLFARADALRDRLGGVGGVDAQPPQNLGGHAALVGEERGEEVVGLYRLAPLRPRASQRPVEEVTGRFGDGHLATHMNGAFGQFLLEQTRDRVRVYADRLHRLAEQRAFDFTERREEVDHREEVVIAALRYLDGAADNFLPRLGKFISH